MDRRTVTAFNAKVAEQTYSAEQAARLLGISRDGRFVPDASDYETGSATNTATSNSKQREVKRAN